MTRHRSSRWPALALFLALGLAPLACSDDDGGDDVGPDSTTTTSAGAVDPGASQGGVPSTVPAGNTPGEGTSGGATPSTSLGDSGDGGPPNPTIPN